jgi:hypothetical protein
MAVLVCVVGAVTGVIHLITEPNPRPADYPGHEIPNSVLGGRQRAITAIGAVANRELLSRGEFISPGVTERCRFSTFQRLYWAKTLENWCVCVVCSRSLFFDIVSSGIGNQLLSHTQQNRFHRRVQSRRIDDT